MNHTIRVPPERVTVRDALHGGCVRLASWKQCLEWLNGFDVRFKVEDLGLRFYGLGFRGFEGV